MRLIELLHIIEVQSTVRWGGWQAGGGGVSSKRRPFDIGVPMVPRLSSYLAADTSCQLQPQLQFQLWLRRWCWLWRWLWLRCGCLFAACACWKLLSTQLESSLQIYGQQWSWSWRCRRCCRCCSRVSYLVACLRLTGPRTGVSGWQRKEHKKG